LKNENVEKQTTKS